MPTDKPVLTKTAEYALRALLVLAHCGRGKPLASAAIAELTGAPTNYLGKTLFALERAGLVRSRRGRTGGYELAAPAEAITVAQIADVFAEPLAARQCLLGTGRCNAAAPCAAHHRWHRLTSEVHEALSSATIASLLVDDQPRAFRAVPARIS
jgi:cysteine desulfurase